jgi:hypothetical protein
MIWEKAQQLYQEEQARTMGTDYKGITATHKELREAGYFHTAKLITLRNLYHQNKNPSALTKNSLRQLKNPSHQSKKQKEVKTCPNKE